MKYTIVRVVFEFPPIMGGSVTHIIELSKAINGCLEKQIIIAPDFEGGHIFDDSFPITVIRLKYLKFLAFHDFLIPSPILFFYAREVVNKIRQLIDNKCNIDIIHVHGTMLGCFIKFFMDINNIHIPLIIMQHGANWDRLGINISRTITNKLTNFLRPDYYIILDDGTNINKIILELKKYYVPVEIVFHGIDTEFFKPVVQKDENIFAILFPHRFAVEKNPLLALKIFRIFIDKIQKKNVRLIFLDSPVHSANLIDSNDDVIDNVMFIGRQDTAGVLEFINSSDVIIGASLDSNMSRAIQEAMACEKTVVVFNSGGTNRLVQNMINGLLVEPGNLEDFAEKIKLIYNDRNLGKRLGKAARETILEERSWKARVTKELNVYEKVISRESNRK